MAMSRIFKTITFLLLFSLTSNGDNDLNFSENGYHNNFKKETKKLYRKYSRFLKSSKIKTQTSKKINATLNHLNSNYDFSDVLYYEFFEFILKPPVPLLADYLLPQNIHLPALQKFPARPQFLQHLQQFQ